jgi:hypothetical protein
VTTTAAESSALTKPEMAKTHRHCSEDDDDYDYDSRRLAPLAESHLLLLDFYCFLTF